MNSTSPPSQPPPPPPPGPPPPETEGFGFLILTSLLASSSLLLIAAVGYALGRLHILSLETRHGLSVLSSRVLLPCVLFTEALTSAIQQPGDDAAVVGFAVVRHLWLVLLTPIVYATLGLIVGWLLTTFVPMPPEHRRLCLVRDSNRELSQTFAGFARVEGNVHVRDATRR